MRNPIVLPFLMLACLFVPTTPAVAKDVSTVRLAQFELKDSPLVTVLQTVQEQAKKQGQTTNLVLVDPKGALAQRKVSVSFQNISLGDLLKQLSKVADFQYEIKGVTITIRSN
jgi:hypothetical protein